MKYLLDTGVLLWAAYAPEKLNRQARTVLSSAASELFLSSASSWEISIKFRLGRLPLPKRPSEFIPEVIQAFALRALDITHFHSVAAGALPMHHRDPFDRMLIVQARLEAMKLLTADTIFKAYGVDALFCGV
jgi:PIN domain nuclease of toxin-antitoxin system